MKFVKKPIVIEATQWFKNGDHPEDDCRTLESDEGPFLSEGKVVRYFRRPDIDDDKECNWCGGTMRDHGWIDGPEGGVTVCPSDWIITGAGGDQYYALKTVIFNHTYEVVVK